MPTASNSAHLTFKTPALPYITIGSPTSTDPHWRGGSNAVIGVGGEHMERRAGFSTTLEPTATALSFTAGETIKDIFQWRKWSGAFITMVCTTTSTSAKVYAYRAGTDTRFTLIYTATAVDGKPFSFAVAANTCFMGNGTAADMRAYDGTGLTTRKWGITAPSAAPTVSTSTVGNTFAITRSKKYCYTYCNSGVPNESSPSSVSSCLSPATGVNAQVVVVASTDTQVDQIRVYATTDGGSDDPPDMREITGSPFTNTSQTITDYTVDTDLGDRTAPAISRNDPPPGMSGIVFAEGMSRIWGFANATAYYSGWEEIGEGGSPYECFPGGVDGNNVPIGDEMTGIAELVDGVALFSASRIVKWEGDSLDTFRRYTLAKKQGARSYRAIVTYGGLCIWLDTSDTIWMLGGQELGKPIVTSLVGIDHTQAQLIIHTEGERRWLLLLDGAGGLIYPFDFNEQKWMPPWNVSATAIHSGETSVGEFSLLANLTSSRKIYKQVEGDYNDGGALYTWSLQSGNLDVAPERVPDWRAAVDFIDIKQNAETSNPTVSQLNDDDPDQGTFVDISANIQDQPLVNQGTYIKAKRYNSAPTTNVARCVAVNLTWPAEDQPSKLYFLDIGFHPFGT